MILQGHAERGAAQLTQSSEILVDKLLGQKRFSSLGKGTVAALSQQQTVA